VSNVAGLRCFRCGVAFPATLTAGLCPACGPGTDATDPGVLDVLYLDPGGEIVNSRTTGIFRYGALLPVSDPGPLLPTGDTPLVSVPRLASRLGLKALYLKDERRSATQCLKDRATAIGVTLAVLQKQAHLYCASAGNAAISLAGYCAHAGLTAHAFVPFDASPVRLGWLRRFGADIIVSLGNYDQAFAESEVRGSEAGWYSRNCAFNPYLVEGKKTVAFEIAEQMKWEAPDWVVAPVGDGCTLAAIGKGFRELSQLGRIGASPQLLGVQADGMKPMVRRFSGEKGEDSGQTDAASIKVRRPRNALRLLSEMRQAGGTMVAAGEEEIGKAQKLLAEECGIVAEFTSAATIAALGQLAQQGTLAGKTAVAVITGGRIDN
jgi:threonine synthase